MIKRKITAAFTARHSLRKPKRRGSAFLCGLGGLEEVGPHMMFFEYKDEIVIIDAGLVISRRNNVPIDFIIPNISYLEANKKMLRP